MGNETGQDGRELARAVCDAIDMHGVSGHPFVAFVDEHGSFWSPHITEVQVIGGRPFVPFTDWQACVGLLEAALRRERAMEQAA